MVRFAGNGTYSFTLTPPGSVAKTSALAAPGGLAYNELTGEIYIGALGHYCVYTVSPSTGLFTGRVAGNNSAGVPEDGAIGNATRINNPADLAWHLDPSGKGRLYIRDAGSAKIFLVIDERIYAVVGGSARRRPCDGVPGLDISYAYMNLMTIRPSDGALIVGGVNSSTGFTAAALTPLPGDGTAASPWLSSASCIIAGSDPGLVQGVANNILALGNSSSGIPEQLAVTDSTVRRVNGLSLAGSVWGRLAGSGAPRCVGSVCGNATAGQPAAAMDLTSPSRFAGSTVSSQYFIADSVEFVVRRVVCAPPSPTSSPSASAAASASASAGSVPSSTGSISATATATPMPSMMASTASDASPTAGMSTSAPSSSDSSNSSGAAGSGSNLTPGGSGAGSDPFVPSPPATNTDTSDLPSALTASAAVIATAVLVPLLILAALLAVFYWRALAQRKRRASAGLRRVQAAQRVIAAAAAGASDSSAAVVDGLSLLSGSGAAALLAPSGDEGQASESPEAAVAAAAAAARQQVAADVTSDLLALAATATSTIADAAAASAAASSAGAHASATATEAAAKGGVVQSAIGTKPDPKAAVAASLASALPPQALSAAVAASVEAAAAALADVRNMAAAITAAESLPIEGSGHGPSQRQTRSDFVPSAARSRLHRAVIDRAVSSLLQGLEQASAAGESSVAPPQSLWLLALRSGGGLEALAGAAGHADAFLRQYYAVAEAGDARLGPAAAVPLPALLAATENNGSSDAAAASKDAASDLARKLIASQLVENKHALPVAASLSDGNDAFGPSLEGVAVVCDETGGSYDDEAEFAASTAGDGAEPVVQAAARQAARTASRGTVGSLSIDVAGSKRSAAAGTSGGSGQPLQQTATALGGGAAAAASARRTANRLSASKLLSATAAAVAEDDEDEASAAVTATLEGADLDLEQDGDADESMLSAASEGDRAAGSTSNEATRSLTVTRVASASAAASSVAGRVTSVTLDAGSNKRRAASARVDGPVTGTATALTRGAGADGSAAGAGSWYGARRALEALVVLALDGAAKKASAMLVASLQEDDEPLAVQLEAATATASAAANASAALHKPGPVPQATGPHREVSDQSVRNPLNGLTSDAAAAPGAATAGDTANEAARPTGTATTAAASTAAAVAAVDALLASLTQASAATHRWAARESRRRAWTEATARLALIVSCNGAANRAFAGVCSRTYDASTARVAATSKRRWRQQPKGKQLKADDGMELVQHALPPNLTPASEGNELPSDGMTGPPDVSDQSLDGAPVSATAIRARKSLLDGSSNPLLLARGTGSERPAGAVSVDRRGSSGSHHLHAGSRKSVVPVTAGCDSGTSDRQGSRRFTSAADRRSDAAASSLAGEGDLDFASPSPLLQLMALKRQAAHGAAAATLAGGSAGGGSSIHSTAAALLHQRIDQQRQLSPALAALMASAIASSTSSSLAAGERRKSGIPTAGASAGSAGAGLGLRASSGRLSSTCNSLTDRDTPPTSPSSITRPSLRTPSGSAARFAAAAALEARHGSSAETGAAAAAPSLSNRVGRMLRLRHNSGVLSSSAAVGFEASGTPAADGAAGGRRRSSAVFQNSPLLAFAAQRSASTAATADAVATSSARGSLTAAESPLERSVDSMSSSDIPSATTARSSLFGIKHGAVLQDGPVASGPVTVRRLRSSRV